MSEQMITKQKIKSVLPKVGTGIGPIKRATLKKTSVFQKLAMSKGVGKVLDSKVGKAGVKVGNAVIKGSVAPLKWAGKQIEKEMRMDEAKDKEYEETAKKETAELKGFQYGYNKKKK